MRERFLAKARKPFAKQAKITIRSIPDRNHHPGHAGLIGVRMANAEGGIEIADVRDLAG